MGMSWLLRFEAWGKVKMRGAFKRTSGKRSEPRCRLHHAQHEMLKDRTLNASCI